MNHLIGLIQIDYIELIKNLKKTIHKKIKKSVLYIFFNIRFDIYFSLSFGYLQGKSILAGEIEIRLIILPKESLIIK